MTKTRFNLLSESGIDINAEETISSIIDMLLNALHVPVKDKLITMVDHDRLNRFGINKEEPINWGALRRIEVNELKDGSFIATIKECAPDGCPTLVNYIESYTKAYGWDVRVLTEW